jgi:tetratricopeptide (TPR) repeat protein
MPINLALNCGQDVLNAALTRLLRKRVMNAALRSSDSYERGLALSSHGRHAEAIDCFGEALTSAPSDPRVLFALGNTARTLGMVKPAEEFFRRVLAIEPGRIEALINLANLLRANGQAEAAKVLLMPALEQVPPSAELAMTFGSVLRELNDADGAEHYYRKALNLKGSYASAQANLADLLAARGDHDEALVLYDRAIKSDPGNAQARLNRAILHLQRGDLKLGWRDYGARLKIPGKAPVCDHNLPAWTGNSLKNIRLLVTAEQGVGDQLMFASMMPELARCAERDGGSVILECEPRLASLFARSFPNITVRPSDMETRGGVVRARYDWLKASGGANAAIEMGTLPRFLRKEIDVFPAPHIYLDPDEMEVLNWQRSLGECSSGPFIGICWRSGKMGSGRALQFAPPELWADFIRDLPGTPVSLQYDATPDEIEALAQRAGRPIIVPDGIDQKRELDRACALMASLDAVVSAPTAVSWISTGAGVPTYKILLDTSWTSFGRDREPFAPSCVCIMPQRAGDWVDSFGQTLAALRSQFSPA